MGTVDYRLTGEAGSLIKAMRNTQASPDVKETMAEDQKARLAESLSDSQPEADDRESSSDEEEENPEVSGGLAVRGAAEGSGAIRNWHEEGPSPPKKFWTKQEVRLESDTIRTSVLSSL